MAKTTRKSKTRQIIDATVRQMHRAISAGLETGIETMDQLVPEDTGFLKSRNKMEDDGAGHGKLENDCEYGIHQEYGTIDMPAQSFFRPALDSGRRAMKREMKIVEK